jgi:hypothetical protein
MSPSRPFVQPPPRLISARRIAAVIAVSTVAGCGYSSEGLYRENISTVYVEAFQSKEFRRDIEFQLTEALRKQIDRVTPYRNAAREKADTILSGEVLEWRESTVGRDFLTDLPRETAATLAIRYRWKDMRTGKILVEKPRFITTTTYRRPVGDNTHEAQEDAANRLARSIVNSMERPW